MLEKSFCENLFPSILRKVIKKSCPELKLRISYISFFVVTTFEAMAPQENANFDRSISLSGDLTGSALVTGDSNKVSIQFQQAALPQPETVDIHSELIALQTILTSFNEPIAMGVAQKLGEEASKPEPSKDTVATALATGLTYAQNLSGFAEAVDKLRPHVEAAAAWLGKHGYKLLPLVGLAL